MCSWQIIRNDVMQTCQRGAESQRGASNILWHQRREQLRPGPQMSDTSVKIRSQGCCTAGGIWKVCEGAFCTGLRETKSNILQVIEYKQVKAVWCENPTQGGRNLQSLRLFSVRHIIESNIWRERERERESRDRRANPVKETKKNMNYVKSSEEKADIRCHCSTHWMVLFLFPFLSRTGLKCPSIITSMEFGGLAGDIIRGIDRSSLPAKHPHHSNSTSPVCNAAFPCSSNSSLIIWVGIDKKNITVVGCLNCSWYVNSL